MIRHVAIGHALPNVIQDVLSFDSMIEFECLLTVCIGEVRACGLDGFSVLDVEKVDRRVVERRPIRCVSRV